MKVTKVKHGDGLNRIEWRNELGELHREDGPAIEWDDDGAKEWYINGLRHREDGPAVEWSGGSTFWFLNGKGFSKKGWKKEVLKLKLKRLSEL